MNNYRNPRSKRKLKAQARKQAKQGTDKVLDYATDLKLYGMTSDEIAASLVRERGTRTEPDTLRPERELSKPYHARGGNKTTYYSKPPALGGVKCALGSD